MSAAENETTPAPTPAASSPASGPSAAPTSVAEQVAILVLTSNAMDLRMRHLEATLEGAHVDVQKVKAEVQGMTHDLASLRTAITLVNDEIENATAPPARKGAR